jgi:hypothetical protein
VIRKKSRCSCLSRAVPGYPLVVEAEPMQGGWLDLSVVLVECTEHRLVLDCVVLRPTELHDGGCLATGEPFSVSINRSDGDIQLVKAIVDVVERGQALDHQIHLCRVDVETLLLSTPAESILIEIETVS